MKQLD
ncbi:hypothetical protein OIU78_001809, partial [Salix suchowensis]